jgi:hypothetical protein
MSNIIIPGKSGIVEAYDPSSGAMIEAGVWSLPGGYRVVGTCTKSGECYDLGQNAEGKFALFRRRTDPFEFYSHDKPQRLAPEDLMGFFGGQFQSVQAIDEDDEYSSLCRTNLVTPDLS